MTALLEEISAVTEIESFNGDSGMADLLTRCREEIERLSQRHPADPSTALAPVATAIEEIDATSSPENLARAIGLVRAVFEWHKANKERLRAGLFAYAEAHGEFVIGETRYRIGCPSETWANDLKETLEAMLHNCDIDTIAGCLSSSAWKPGACRDALPQEIFANLFTTEAKPKLIEGKPLKGQRQLIEESTVFAKGR